MNDFFQLLDVIEEATEAMGLGIVGGINSRAFSRGVLSVEITGPARPQLYASRAIASPCKEFIDTVLQDAAPSEFKDRPSTLYIDDALTQALTGAKEELHKILKDKDRHPTTYNHYFTTTVQKMRQRKHQKITKKASKASEVSIYDCEDKLQKYVDPGKLTEAMYKAMELDMDVFSGQEALDIERVFYKDEMKYFFNAVTKAVIERHLAKPLPDIILSPLVVTQMTEKEIEFVAAEPPETTQQRLHLESKQSMLEKGLETFRKAMCGLKC
jgi:hypothetical protein